MKQLNINRYVFTRDGFKDANSIQINTDKVSNTNSFNNVTFTSTNKQQLSLTNYTYLQTSINAYSTLLHNDSYVLATTQSVYMSPVQVKDINVDDWVFNTWLPQSKDNVISYIDLAPTSNTSYDLQYLYNVDNSITQASSVLDIPMHALKELLSREAAEYDKYLPKLKKYIEDKYGVKESNNEEVSFKNFKQYLKDNFLFKQKRHIEKDKLFTSLLLAYFKNSTNSIKEDNKNYKLEFTFNKNCPLYKDILLFIKKYSLKHSVFVNNTNFITLTIENNPLVLYLVESIKSGTKLLLTMTEANKSYFVKNLFNDKEIIVNFETYLTLFELFNQYKIVLKNKDYQSFLKVSVATDDFESIESTLIIEEDGYYTRVIGLSEIESDSNRLYTTLVVSGDTSNTISKYTNFLTHIEVMA